MSCAEHDADRTLAAVLLVTDIACSLSALGTFSDCGVVRDPVTSCTVICVYICT